VRPHCQAVPKPRHNIINGGKGNARGSSKVIPRWKQSLIYGRAEPAPRGCSSSNLLTMRAASQSGV